MIWGGGGNFRNEFIFSREPLPYKFFSSARPLKASRGLFLQKGVQIFFPLKLGLQIFFPGESLSKFIFLGECLSKFIFSWRVPLKIYFFLEKGLRFFFSFSISSAPQIINGRPLRHIFSCYIIFSWKITPWIFRTTTSTKTNKTIITLLGKTTKI